MLSHSNGIQLRLLASLALGIFLVAPADGAKISQPNASAAHYKAPNGDVFFALQLRATDANLKAQVARDHILMVDTSASQFGAHRVQALAVLDEFLARLPKIDRVCLYAVDVQAKQLTKGFASVGSDNLKAGILTLKSRAPLGATDFPRALNAALKTIQKERVCSILYIGDGMSTADLYQAGDLKVILTQLRDLHVPIHSYAVGPRTDLRMLGVLGQHTGGFVVFDRGFQEHGKLDNSDPDVVATQLIAAVSEPIYYPESLEVKPAIESFDPMPLPLRRDRDTIYFGRGKITDGTKISTSNSSKDQVTFNWNISIAADSEGGRGNAFFAALYKRIQQDDGLNPIAGSELLNVARHDFDTSLERLAGLGRQAIARKQLNRAELIGLQIQKLDPGNQQAEVLIGAANRIKVNGFAFAQPPVDQQPPADGTAPPTGNSGDVTQYKDRDAILDVLDRRRIRTEQMQLQVSRAIEDARRMVADDNDAALSLLKKTLGAVQAASDVNPNAQQQMLRQIRAEMSSVRNRREIDLESQIRAQERLAVFESEKNLINQMLLDDAKLRNLIEQVRSAIDRGTRGDDAAYKEAKAVADAAVKLRPGNGTAAAARFNSEAAGQLNSAFRWRNLRADRFLEALEQVEISHVPFPDEPPIRWPPAEVWKQLTERRKKWSSVDLHKSSPAEDRIREALNEQTEIEFTDTPLIDAVEFLSDLHNIPIIIDETALGEEGIATDEPVNMVLSGITLRSALKLILRPLGLTYVIEDEVMQITTTIAADEKLSTRVYPVGDLVIQIQSMAGQGGGQQGGFGGGQQGGGQQGGFGGGGGQQGGGGGFFSVPVPDLKKSTTESADRNSGQKPAAGLNNSNVRSLKKKRTTSR